MFEVCIMYSDIMVRYHSQYIIVCLKLFMQHLLDFFNKNSSARKYIYLGKKLHITVKKLQLKWMEGTLTELFALANYHFSHHLLIFTWSKQISFLYLKKNWHFFSPLESHSEYLVHVLALLTAYIYIFCKLPVDLFLAVYWNLTLDGGGGGGQRRSLWMFHTFWWIPFEHCGI